VNKLAAASASALLALVLLSRCGAEAQQTEAAPSTPSPVKHRSADPVVKATGVIKPMIGAEVRVGSRISGVVRRLYVRVGDSVRSGQALAELDDRDLVARRNEAQAQLDQAGANADYARADLRRKQELKAGGLLADADLDVAARAGHVADQQVAGARANLVFAATQVGYARVDAPISGVVASVSTQEGETVAASFATPTFVTLVDLTRLEVWAYVDETDIGRIRIGQPARFTVDTYGDEEFEGRITAIYPKPEIRDNVVNYITVIRFDPPKGRTLRPEMTTTVRITTDAKAAEAAASTPNQIRRPQPESSN
jgi:RND family efflux transporter MFP subunit